MLGIKVEVTYYGKEKKIDPKTKELIEHREEYQIKDNDSWKEGCIKEFRNILDKYKGIKEVRFFV